MTFGEVKYPSEEWNNLRKSKMSFGRVKQHSEQFRNTTQIAVCASSMVLISRSQFLDMRFQTPYSLSNICADAKKFDVFCFKEHFWFVQREIATHNSVQHIHKNELVSSAWNCELNFLSWRSGYYLEISSNAQPDRKTVHVSTPTSNAYNELCASNGLLQKPLLFNGNLVHANDIATPFWSKCRVENLTHYPRGFISFA